MRSQLSKKRTRRDKPKQKRRRLKVAFVTQMLAAALVFLLGSKSPTHLVKLPRITFPVSAIKHPATFLKPSASIISSMLRGPWGASATKNTLHADASETNLLGGPVDQIQKSEGNEGKKMTAGNFADDQRGKKEPSSPALTPARSAGVKSDQSLLPPNILPDASPLNDAEYVNDEVDPEGPEDGENSASSEFEPPSDGVE
jgi:hypothetical protein